MKVGDVVGGGYQLVRPIGEGNMGSVWEALHEPTGQRVALKLILRPNEDLRLRLLREARLCGSLRHENIVELHDVAETEKGEPFLVMELLAGETVAELLQRRHALSSTVAARIGRDVALALSAAHEARIIHRDLKPSNILLHRTKATSDFVVKVLDFGIAKQIDTQDCVVTTPGAAVGSLAYMSPEQLCVAKDLDPSTDIWSLGVVLFEIIVGVRPFRGSQEEIVRAILTENAPLVSRRLRQVDPGLAGVIARCLTRDREKRIQSARDLAALLDGYTRGLSLADELASAPAEPPRPGSNPGRAETARPAGSPGMEYAGVESGELITRHVPAKITPPDPLQRQVTPNGTVVLGPADLSPSLRHVRVETQPLPDAASVRSATAQLDFPPHMPRPVIAAGRDEHHSGATSTDGIVRWVEPARPGSVPELAPPPALTPPVPTEPERRRFIDFRIASCFLIGALALLAFAVLRGKAPQNPEPTALPIAVPPIMSEAPKEAAPPPDPSVPAPAPTPAPTTARSSSNSTPTRTQKANTPPLKASAPAPRSTSTPTPGMGGSKPPTKSTQKKSGGIPRDF